MVIVRFFGMLLKVAWALLWQENAYGSHVKPIVTQPLYLLAGVIITPFWNKGTNFLNRFTHTDE